MSEKSRQPAGNDLRACEKVHRRCNRLLFRNMGRGAWFHTICIPGLVIGLHVDIKDDKTAEKGLKTFFQDYPYLSSYLPIT
jgi:hypothetical protein